MLDAGRHPNIFLWTYSEVLAVEGEAGDFKVKVKRKPRYVDVNKCTGCGICWEKCPKKVLSEFDHKVGLRKAIYIPFAQAVPKRPVMDKENCIYFEKGKCQVCKKLCPSGAILFEQKEEIQTINVGSIVVAVGFEEYDPTPLTNLGYGRFKNILTGIEFERILNASGPTTGHLIRPSDRKAPNSLAFVQCVGSRSNDGRGCSWCSYFCCMNAIKNSLLAKSHEPGIEKIYIFYNDIRAFGKGYEELYLRAQQMPEVIFYKGKPSKIEEDPTTKDLWIAIENMDTGKVERIKSDIAILSSAAIPAEGSQKLAQVLGIETDSSGFFKTKDSSSPLESTKEGIYLCGCSGGLRDISESVATGSAAALNVSGHLKGNKVKKEPIQVTPIDISGPPRIGVFVCHCGINIAGVVDVASVEEYAKKLPNVVYCTKDLFVCSDGTQREMQQKIKEYNLNRVVVAACTPRTHEPIFQETCAQAGLNPYLFEMANIRDQCSWVHSQEPEEATLKSKDLIRMAVAKATRLQPLESREVPMNPKILVIGGGISGIQAALNLSSLGYKVTLIEKEMELGGRVKDLGKLFLNELTGKELIAKKIEELKKNKIEIMTSAQVSEVKGFVGNFEVIIEKDKKKKKSKFGTIIMAIGSDLFDPQGKYRYGEAYNVITNMELERLLAEGEEFKIKEIVPQNMVFIQCVGSREKEKNFWCSRYCCQTAIKHALALQKKGIKVTVLYRDIRVFNSGAEEAYREARKAGVLFLRYDEKNPPIVLGEGKATRIIVKPSGTQEEIEIPVDAVILSVGMVPKEKEFADLQTLLKVPRGLDGFFMERHSKLGPVETNTEGIFICGCAHSPKNIIDSIGQAIGAAGKAAILAGKENIKLSPTVCQVETLFCRSCGTCVKVCEFHAPNLEEKDGFTVAVINEALCKGCGTCAALCPTGAIVARHFTDEQIESMVESCLAWD